ncbi:MAG: hypothetical protein J0H73_11825 [Salana multivorans]|uniref:hypothetical protein n=1 Tax=Salana multivorans TaxID=120377 RepID=UPI00095B65EC|nr:hypothetical protein [Salana multivorans]MBN8882988.1 hypothetical protein [Salana multivorans]OJX94060.1 MAG: hypothetical protein BGO96_09645 [Micrococcales bacterium 73-15]
MSDDITEALAPASDQLDAIELVEPRTFEIAPGSRIGTRDGKTVAEVRLVDFPRVWRPSKGMLDVLAACWGKSMAGWAGRRVTLYNDPDVRFGADVVGGVRISRLSGIDAERTVMIRKAGGRPGQKVRWRVQPLPDAPAPVVVTDDLIDAATTTDELRAMWSAATPDQQDRIRAKVAEIGG